MPQILIRELDADIVERLRERARQNGRSLEAEVRVLLREVAGRKTRKETAAAAARLRAELSARAPVDSVGIIREDRDSEHRDVPSQW